MTKKKVTTIDEDLAEILEIIETAENSAMAADGPVRETVSHLEDGQLTRIYRLAKRGKRRAARILRRAGEDRKIFLEDLDTEKVARALHDVAERDVLPEFRRKWEELTKGRRQRYATEAAGLKTSLFKVRAVR